jgi:riboflavin synthase
MFTGIIERTAHVIGIADSAMFRRLTLSSGWTDVRPGESIAVNGVCLTVAELAPGELGFDVIPETLRKTNLGMILPGDAAHVERALRVGDRLDGHFVQGHVDGTATLVESISNDKEVLLRLQAPADLAKYLTPEGSVTLDGVSLTLASVRGKVFEVALIPTTLQLTLLGRRTTGWLFNLECDCLAKTVVAWLERSKLGADDM